MLSCAFLAWLRAERYRHMHACGAAVRLPAYMFPFVGLVALLALCQARLPATLELHCCTAQDACRLHNNHPQLHPQAIPTSQSLQSLFVVHLACTFHFHAAGLHVSVFLHIPVLSSSDPTCDGSFQVGYPVLLKATGGGGGIGIYICHSKDDLVKNFETAGRCDLHVWDCMYGTACMGKHGDCLQACKSSSSF